MIVNISYYKIGEREKDTAEGRPKEMADFVEALQKRRIKTANSEVFLAPGVTINLTGDTDTEKIAEAFQQSFNRVFNSGGAENGEQDTMEGADNES